MSERENVPGPRLPSSVAEQIINLPDFCDRAGVCVDLARKLSLVLETNGIEYSIVSFRPKTDDKIKEKLTRRGGASLMRDIYGVRFITEEKDRLKIAKIVQDAFPFTPESFPDGMPSVRDYADPKVRDFVRSNFNPGISSRHSAMHINIVFLREGSSLFDIAEVQILTPEEMRIFKETREEYESGRN
ncbi:MAG TPA: hypothetical protein VJ227_00265 [Patescibacteria group bacterium]|nr:hypothetical protein [Patescibacteria group bacterium]